MTTLAQSRLAPLTGRLAPAYRRFIEPVLRIPSVLGWSTFAAGIVVIIAGRRLGWYELVICGMLLLAALVIAVAFVIGRFGYAVTVSLASTRVTVGDHATGSLRVRNVTSHGLLPAVIELPVGQGHAGFPLPRLAAGAEHEDLFDIPTARRGVIVVGPVQSVRRDPVGLLRRSVTWTEPEELFIHPRTVSLDGSSAGFLKDLEGRPTADLSSSDVAFHALREYVPGDDRRHIHWRSVARTGRLMVRQFEETRRSHLALALSESMADYGPDPEEFELAVSTAASLGLQAFREEKQLTVLAQDREIAVATGRRMLDDLCRIDPIETTGIVDLAATISARVPGMSVAVLFVGSQTSAAALRDAAARLPLGVDTIAMRCCPGATVSRASIGSTTVLTLGRLDDLPLAMHRIGA